MSIRVGFHISANEPGKLKVSSRRQGHLSDNHKSALVSIELGLGTLSLFFDNVADIERIGTELQTLAMEIRTEGWDPNATV